MLNRVSVVQILRLGNGKGFVRTRKSLHVTVAIRRIEPVDPYTQYVVEKKLCQCILFGFLL